MKGGEMYLAIIHDEVASTQIPRNLTQQAEARTATAHGCFPVIVGRQPAVCRTSFLCCMGNQRYSCAGRPSARSPYSCRLFKAETLGILTEISGIVLPDAQRSVTRGRMDRRMPKGAAGKKARQRSDGGRVHNSN